MGGLGREGLFTIATDGNLQKQFYMPTINVSLFAISGTIMTKLDSFSSIVPLLFPFLTITSRCFPALNF